MYIPPADYGHSEPSPEVAYPDGSLPDYTAEPFSAAPSHLIPPPDYGQKQYEPKVDYDSYENVIEYDAPVSRRDTVVPVRTYVEQQIHTVPTPEEPQETYSDRQAKEHNPIVQTPADVPRHSYVPQLPPKDNFVAHSYLEDKDKIVPSKDKQKSMRSHIRSIGVPVLPPIGGNDHEFFTGKSPAQNKAFIRHMENHRNFDTMKSLKSCENCPICQMMSKEELEAAGNDPHHAHSSGPPKLDSGAGRGRRGDVRDLFAPAADETQWTRTKRSYRIKNEGEMDVDFREKVEVLNREGSHLLCRKTDGSLGWLPLYIVH